LAFERCNQQERERIGSTARICERLAAPLLGCSKFAASTGNLDAVTKSAIGEKYTHLDEIIDILHAQTSEPRDVPTW
jgi:hypothetical protein